MKNTIIPLLAALSLALVSCGHKTTDEEAGAAMLNQARQHLREGNSQAARDTILSLRKRYPRAAEARRAAILTLDSVELYDAMQAQDSLKTEFFLRKIKADKGEALPPSTQLVNPKAPDAAAPPAEEGNAAGGVN